jgi:hypothetical protein
MKGASMHQRVPHLAHRGLFATALVAPLALFGVLVHAQEGKKPDAMPMTAKQKYKNIKVLKDLPADKLIPVMHEYNTALGVGCNFCHVINADHSGFDKDDKPMKLKARTMIVLVKDLNRKYKTIDQRATCAMCHHGHAEPETSIAAGAPR